MLFWGIHVVKTGRNGISVEIDASVLQGAEIPYEGGQKMISIKTNSNWEIASNEWVTFNKI